MKELTHNELLAVQGGTLSAHAKSDLGNVVDTAVTKSISYAGVGVLANTIFRSEAGIPSLSVVSRGATVGAAVGLALTAAQYTWQAIKDVVTH